MLGTDRRSQVDKASPMNSPRLHPEGFCSIPQSHIQNAGHVRLVKEWEHVMLTQTVHPNVLDQNHLIVGLTKEGRLRNF